MIDVSTVESLSYSDVASYMASSIGVVTTYVWPD